MSQTAPTHDSSDADFYYRDADGRYHGLDMTAPFNFIGQCPALSVPCGWTAGGLPVGLQMVGHRFDDATVMRIGGALQSLRPWAYRRPPGGGRGTVTDG